jgi:hypothetical protein
VWRDGYPLTHLLLPVRIDSAKEHTYFMSTVEEIERAVRELPPEELALFRAWFAEFDAGVWDRQIEADVAAGRLDALAEAGEERLDRESGQRRGPGPGLQDLREGRCTDL